MSDLSSPAARLRQIYERLAAAYGPQYWWPAETPLEVVLGTYLTQGTSWKSVERAIANLKAHDLLTLDALRFVPLEELRELIRPSGYMVRKAASLKAFVALLDSDYSGSLESLSCENTLIARAKLLALPGVGPETADAILVYALEKPAMVVDEYLRRVTTRHRLLPERASYDAIQQLALSAFAREPSDQLTTHCNEFHALIVQVGKLHCGPRPRCEDCPLRFDLEQQGILHA